MSDPLQAFMEQNKGLLSFEPTEADRKKALTYGLIGAGLGILSANAHNPRGAGFAGAVGGAMPGLQMYQQTLHQAPRERLQNLGGMMQLRNLQSGLKRDEAMQNMQFKNPAAQALAAAGMFKEAMDREYPQQKLTTVGRHLLDTTPGQEPKTVFEAPAENKIGPAGQVYNPYQIKPGDVLQDPNKPFAMGPQGPVPNLPFQNYEIGKSRAGATNVTQNVAMPGDNKYIDERRKFEAGQLGDLTKAAQSAYNQFGTLDRFIKASEKGFAGGAAPVMSGVTNFLTSFGYSSESLKDTRVMEQAIGDILGNKMAELGARGLTDKDMEILRQALPRVETDKESRVAIAKVLKKSAAHTLNEYHNAREEEARIYPDLKDRTPNAAWYKDYITNRQKFNPGGRRASDQMPKVGAVIDGYKFKGGDPSLRENWEQAK